MLIRQHLSLIKMNVHIFSLTIWKSFVHLHGIRNWKTVVLSGLAMIMEEGPPVTPSVLHAIASLLESGTCNRGKISKNNQFFMILEYRVKEQRWIQSNLIQDSFTSLLVLFTFLVKRMSLHNSWGWQRIIIWLLESCLLPMCTCLFGDEVISELC